MPSLLARPRMIARALQERVARTERARIPEPMVMDEPEAVAAFHVAHPVLQLPVYRYNAIALSRLLPPDGTLFDLGSGTGRLLAHLAEGRQDVRMIGTDLAETMLRTGREMLAQEGLDGRIELRQADMTDLGDAVPDQLDVISCMWALHHLPSADLALACLRGIARIRERTGCGVWLFDFARMRRNDTLEALMSLAPDVPERLTADGLASERAAWSAKELKAMLREAGLGDLRGGPERTIGHMQAYGAHARHGRPSGHAGWSAPPLPRAAIQPYTLLKAGMPRTVD